MNESFKSAVSVIVSDSSSSDEGNPAHIQTGGNNTVASPGPPRDKMSPFAHLLMEHVVNFDKEDNAIHGSATVISDATAYQLNNAKLTFTLLIKVK